MEYLIVAAAAVALYLLATIRPVTLFEYERGVRYRKGRYRGTIGPGRHWIYQPQTRIRRIDARPRFVTLGGQEVLSSDGVTLKVSLAAEYEVVDPAIAINTVEDFEGSLYVTLQLALRQIIGQAKIEDVLAGRGEFGPAVVGLSAQRAEEMGLRLLRVDVKDIMFPGELKRIFAQVVQAQKEGQAALEKARGETAVLRNLANAARMVNANPSLLQLRLLQQLSGSTGNTVILGFPPQGTPIPLKEGTPLPGDESTAEED